MDETNPYAPGAGREPIRLPGRAEAQIWWRRSLTEIQGTGQTGLRGRVFTGVRGIGKTALLRNFERVAREAGFGVVSVQAGGANSLRDYLRDGLADLSEADPSFTDEHGRLTELSVEVGLVGVSGAREFVEGHSSERAEETVFLEAVEQAANRFRAAGTGLVLLIDEAQEADLPSLTSVCRVQHLLRTPALQIVIAGLPGLEDRLDEAMSHADRLFEYEVLGNLDEAATREALVEPAMTHGVQWEPGALDAVVERSGGYPSFIQEFGYAIWNARAGSNRIDAEIVARGSEAARHTIDRQYRSVWRAATPIGRDYLTALALLGGTARVGEVARALGRTDSRQLSVALRALKSRGAVSSPAYGYVTFVRPGMDSWIRDNEEQLQLEQDPRRGVTE